MDYTKHIRTSYKNAGPPRLGAGRLLAFLGAGDARGKSRAAGVMVFRWWPAGRCCGLPGMAGAGNDPAAIRLNLISH